MRKNCKERFAYSTFGDSNKCFAIYEEVIIRVLDRAVDNFTRPIKFNPMMTF